MIRSLLLLVAGASVLGAQTADEIMQKVALHQDESAAARAQFVFHQNLLIRLKHTDGKLAREEVRDYTVTPTKDGMQRELVQLAGKLRTGNQLIDYDNPDYRHSGMDIDGEIVQGLADDFGVDKKSKDGIDPDLFPLRTEEMKKYDFKRVADAKWEDRDVYEIDFTPKKHIKDDECWGGEVLVDKTEFQPVVVTSHLSCKIPIVVKTVLGTNIQHLGFKLTYRKFDGVWFPVTYGGEFKFRAAFVYARSVGLGLVNSDFKRAKVDTAIQYEITQ